MKPVLFFTCLILNINTWGQELSRKVDAVVKPLLDDYPGIQVAIGSKNKVVFQKSYGYADLARQMPTDNEDFFRIYSLSKLITTVSLLQLVEKKGELNPDKPVMDYIPSWNEPLINPWNTKITARHLAFHQSGIRHYSGIDEVYSSKQCNDVDDALSIFNESYLLFEPGTGRSYSSWGYVLLCALIEKTSGISFNEYVMNNVFDKINSNNIQMYDRNAINRLVAGYEKDVNKAYRDVSYVNLSCKFGAGGFISNAEDMVKFGMILMQGQLISKGMVKLIMDGDITDDRFYIAGGVSAGGRSILGINTQTGNCVVILGNQRGEPFDQALKQILGFLE